MMRGKKASMLFQPKTFLSSKFVPMKIRMLQTLFWFVLVCCQGLLYNPLQAQVQPTDQDELTQKLCLEPKITIYDGNDATVVTFPHPTYFQYAAKCDAKYKICLDFGCALTTAPPTYRVDVTAPDGTLTQYHTGSGPTWCFGHQFDQTGIHSVTIKFYCGRQLCHTVTFLVHVCDCPCECGKMQHYTFNAPHWRKGIDVKCDSTYEYCSKDSVYLSGKYLCRGDCKAKYQYYVNSVAQTSNTTGYFKLPSTPGIYTITLVVTCGEKTCYKCAFRVTIKDCPDDCCGKWENTPDLFNDTHKYKDVCDKGFEVPCGKYNLVGNYLCKGNCKPTYDITVTPAAGGPAIYTSLNDATLNEVIPFTSDGGYLVTVVVKCNGKICDRCIFKVFVYGCKCECPKEGLGWKPLQLNAGPIATPLECGKIYPVNCNVKYEFLAAYNCAGADCEAKIVGQVIAPDGTTTPFSGGAINLPIMFTQTGTYWISMQPYCDGKPCPPCRIGFKVECPPQDCCGEWVKKPILSGNGISLDDLCGKGFGLKCGRYLLDGVYRCKGNCQATYDITVTPANGGPAIYSSLNDATLAEVINFGSNGAYIVTIIVKCDGKVCDTCRFEVKVEGCKCDCAPQGQGWKIALQDANDPALGLILKCGETYNAKCNTKYNLFANYACIGDDCQAKIEGKIVAPDGSSTPFSGASPINQGVIFTQTGLYTIILQPYCDGKPCEPCRIFFKVECPQDCCGEWEKKPQLRFEGGAIEDICGKGFELSCGKYLLQGAYRCKGNCKATYDVVFKDATTGAVLYSSFNDASLAETIDIPYNGFFYVSIVVKCDGKVCETCEFKFKVNDCKCECPKEGEGWKIGLLSPAATGAADLAGIAIKCGGTYEAKCNVKYNIVAAYACVGENCQSKIEGKIVAPDGSTQALGGSPINESVVFTQSGVYTVFLQPYCDGKPCPPCRFQIKVECPPSDCCGQWEKKPSLSNLTTIVSGICGQGFELKCGSYQLQGLYICKGNCKASYDIRIFKADGTPFYTSLNDATLSEALNFTANGGYYGSIVVKCDGKECEKCEFKFVVSGCPQEDCCGEWEKKPEFFSQGNTISNVCGNGFGVKCGKYILQGAYRCKGNCKATYDITIFHADGTPFYTSLNDASLNEVLNFTANGAFYGTIVVKCDGKECEKCIFKFQVDGCPQEDCCGEWERKPTLHSSTGVLDGICGKTITVKCDKYSILGSYKCKGECKPSFDITVKPTNGGPQFYSSLNDATLNEVLNFDTSGIYEIRIVVKCGGKPCDTCVFKVIVECPKDCCGEWVKKPVLAGNGQVLDGLCGKGFELKCGKYELAGLYQCKGDCKATYDIYVNPSNGGPAIYGSMNDATLNEVINFGTNGTYVVTIIVKCGGKICDRCEFKVTVSGCTCVCPPQGQGWEKIQLNVAGNITNVKCGETYAAKCNQLYFVEAIFNCNGGGDCENIKGSIIAPNGTVTPFSGGDYVGVPVIFNQSGTYTVLLQPYCSGVPCAPCRFFVKVDCPPTDCCGQWEKTPTLSGNGINLSNLCDKSFELKCGKYELNGLYICKGDCKANYSVKVVRDGNVTVYNTTNDATLNEVIPFLTNGTYEVYIEVKCGDKVCAKCYFRVKVGDCKCDCPTETTGTNPWTSLQYVNNNVNTKLKCGDTTKVKCNKLDTLLAVYNCVGSVEQCGSIKATITSPQGVSATFVLNAPAKVIPLPLLRNGLWKVQLEASCGGKVCNKCVLYFNVAGCLIIDTPIIALPNFQDNEVKFKAFPNPTNGTLNIDLPDTDGESYQLIVRDLSGKVLLQQKSQSARENLSLENLARGTYFLEATSSKNRFKTLIVRQ
jgi:hypothetical protein